MSAFKGNIMIDDSITFDFTEDKYILNAFCDDRLGSFFYSIPRPDSVESLGEPFESFDKVMYRHGKLYIQCGKYAQMYPDIVVNSMSAKQILPNLTNPDSEIKLTVTLKAADKIMLEKIKQHAKDCRFPVK